MKARILLIEGKRADRPSFVAGLTRKGYQVESVPNGSVALAHLEPPAPDLIIIDAASMRTSGKRICQSLRARMHNTPLVLIVDPHQMENHEKENLADAI